jgi:hypothetical protein
MPKRLVRKAAETAVGVPKVLFEDAWEQLLGVKQDAETAKEGLAVEEENLKLKRQISFERRRIREHRELGVRETREVQIQIEDLRRRLQKEIIRLNSELTTVSQEVSAITVEQFPSDSGVYHLNFFQWILEILAIARRKVQEANTWLALWQSRSAKQRGMLYGFTNAKGPKSMAHGVHMMIGGEMGSARSGA